MGKPLPQTIWHEVDLVGTRPTFVREEFPGLVVVGGSRNGRTVVASVGAAGIEHEYPVPKTLAGNGSFPRDARSNYDHLLVINGSASLWMYDRESEASRVLTVPEDEAGAAAERLWVTGGDEELRVVAAYPSERQNLELRVLDENLDLLPTGRHLWIQGPVEDVQVGSFAAHVVVAGPMSTDAGHGDMSLWWALNRSSLEDWDPRPWEEIPFESVPGRLTDACDWESLCYFAGPTAEGQPGAWEAELGSLQQTNDIHLDPARPVVLIAEAFPDGPEPDGEVPTTLAGQTATGGVLLFRDREIPMPDGELRAVAVTRGFDAIRCFAIIDDALHVGLIE